MSKLLLPNALTSMSGSKLDAKAIREAIETLGIKGPVQIKWTGGWNRRGAHRFYPDGRHVITLSTRFGVRDTSSTLWHELTHAEQTERLGSKEFSKQYSSENRSKGYRNNKFEREARANGDAFGDEYPLLTQSRPRTVKEIR